MYTHQSLTFNATILYRKTTIMIIIMITIMMKMTMIIIIITEQC